MAVYGLENEEIRIQVNSLGAELRSLLDVKSGHEYMWSGDEKYWGRVSPILFPVVGCCRNKEFRYKGDTYSLPQHGFARDMEFTFAEQTKDEMWFRLADDEETRAKYPFAFVLEIGYRLTDRSVCVMWRVHNPAKEALHFSIGGHPGFMAPTICDGKPTCYIDFDGIEQIRIRKINDGLAMEETAEIKLDAEGLLPVTMEAFAGDALVVENNQTHKVSLLDKEKKPFVTVSFDAPLFGIWTPPNQNAPFICIEPWYGRCDGENFSGSIEEREWGNLLSAGETFKAAYTIEV